MSNMIRPNLCRLLRILPLVWLVAACGNSNDNPGEDLPSVAAGNTRTSSTDASGKPGAPIRIRYNVLGNPIVGQPVGVSLEIFSAKVGEQVTVHYRINDATAMQFPESQSTSIEFRATRIEEPQIEQVTVVPMREGRLFLNVSAEVEGPNGSMFKSLAIPIQAGSAPEVAVVNGELVEGPDGEGVISMPAEEQ